MPTPRTPSVRRRSGVVALALAAGGLLGACGGDGDDASSLAPETPASEAPTDESSTPSGDAAEPVVEIERSRYSPTELEVGTGTTVEFVNLDAVDHTVTSAEDSPVEFDSGTFGQDETFTQTFDEPGTYGYFCQIHPTMRASVVVS